jgi:hypothetical protein
LIVSGLAFSNFSRSATFVVGCSGTQADVGDLVAAIDFANDEADFPGPDVIELAPTCIYQFEQPNNYWYGPNALPAIQSEILVEGHGATLLRSPLLPGDTPHSFRFIYVSGGLTGELARGNLTLHGLTLAGGLSKGGDSHAGGGGSGMGGAIFNQGSLTLRGVTLVGNVARGGDSSVNGIGDGGGGMGEDAPISGNGGGFGGSLGGVYGGSGGSGGDALNIGGGGGGFVAGSDGANAASLSPGNGGGLGQLGGHGDGGTGGGPVSGQVAPGGSGGDFGSGGFVAGGGGGVGGGGGSGGGSGGFGGGGGNSEALSGASGGFGGGAGARPGTSRSHFGGGAASSSAGGGGAGLGGAIFNHRGVATLINVTAFGNEAVGGSASTDAGAQFGSGIGSALFNLNGTVAVEFSTIDGNIVRNSNADIGVGDAAVFSLMYRTRIEDGTASFAGMTFGDSIVVGSTATGGAGANDVVNDIDVAFGTPYFYYSSDLTFSHTNIVGAYLANAPNSVHGSIPVNMDPQISPLAQNGATDAPMTMAVSPGSPAIGADSGACALYDAREFGRPLVYCTLGAYEVAPVLDRIFGSSIETNLR